MASLAFHDKIVNASDLRKNQKYWLEKAASQPVTVTYGINNLAILNRDQLRKLYQQSYYMEKAIQFYTSVVRQEKSDVFPWLDYLDAGDMSRFITEFTDAVLKAISIDDWSDVETLLEDWKATAETFHDRAAMRALKAKSRKADYIALE